VRGTENDIGPLSDKPQQELPGPARGRVVKGDNGPSAGREAGGGTSPQPVGVDDVNRRPPRGVMDGRYRTLAAGNDGVHLVPAARRRG